MKYDNRIQYAERIALLKYMKRASVTLTASSAIDAEIKKTQADNARFGSVDRLVAERFRRLVAANE